MVQEFTDQNFNKETQQGIVLVDFWAPWCGPCKMQGPIVEDIAKQFVNTHNVTIGKMNVDENPVIAQEYQIFSIPTIIIFKDGKPATQAIGLQSKNSILEKLNRVIGS